MDGGSVAGEFASTSSHPPLGLVVELNGESTTLFIVGYTFQTETGQGEVVVALGDGAIAAVSQLEQHGVTQVYGLGPVQQQRSPLAVPGR